MLTIPNSDHDESRPDLDERAASRGVQVYVKEEERVVFPGNVTELEAPSIPLLCLTSLLRRRYLCTHTRLRSQPVLSTSRVACPGRWQMRAETLADDCGDALR